MKYLKREAIARRIDDVVAAVAKDPAADARLRGFAVRSPSPECMRGDATDEEQARVREVLGEDAASSRILRFAISGEKRAGDGLALKMSGGKLDRYAKNPVVLHQHWRGPVGHSIVWTENASDGVPRMRSLVAMLSRDLSQAFDGGFSWALGELAHRRGHAASIGFDVLDAVPAPPEARAMDPWAMDVNEWELLEWSLVKIPMDPDAVMEARADGVDVDPLASGFARLLDELGSAGVGRAQIEAAWAAASGTRAKHVAVAAGADGVDADAIRAALREGAGQLLQR